MFEPTILSPALQDEHPHLLTSIAELHLACIEKDILLSHFEEPFDVAKIHAYWALAALEPGREIIFIHSKNKGEAAAVVMLSKPFIDTGSANATVANLLVDEDYRRMNMSRDLMRKVEEVASAAGKTQIHLDVEMGSKAELVFQKFGYSKTLMESHIKDADGTVKTMREYVKDLKASDAVVL